MTSISGLRSTARRAVGRILARLLRLLPHSGPGNRLFHAIMFRGKNHKWHDPGRRLYNDVIHRRKISGELETRLYRQTSDKAEVKEYLTDIFGPEICPQTYALFDSTDEIDVAALPKPSVIKPTHSSGQIVLLSPDDTTIPPEAIAGLERDLRDDYYAVYREANYRHLPRRLICERMIEHDGDLKDYKIHCYGGRARIVQVDSNRRTGHLRNLYDRSWSEIRIRSGFPRGTPEPAPAKLPRMLEMADRVAKDFPILRVDFYLAEGRIMIGELTHCPAAGYTRFGSVEEERRFSEVLFGDDPPTPGTSTGT